MTDSGRIVVAGEALIDLVPAGGGELRAHPGGGPFNTARAAARLGAPVAFLGRLSSDRFGLQLRAVLEGDGVAVHTAVVTDDPTTLAVAEVDRGGGATYRFYVEGTSATGLTAAQAAAALPEDAAMLCVGTLGLVFEPSAGALEALVAAAGDGVLVAVDPNCRPAAIPDPEAYRARLDRIVARADLVKASDADLEWLEPGLGPAAAMRALIGAGRSAACAGIVTLGADGALVVPAAGGEPIAVAAPPVDVVDTIGAGDAFLGGLLAWWQRAGRDRGGLADVQALTAAVRYAVAVAARTCARPGADPPYADDPRLIEAAGPPS